MNHAGARKNALAQFYVSCHFLMCMHMAAAHTMGEDECWMGVCPGSQELEAQLGKEDNSHVAGIECTPQKKKGPNLAPFLFPKT